MEWNTRLRIASRAREMTSLHLQRTLTRSLRGDRLALLRSTPLDFTALMQEKAAMA